MIPSLVRNHLGIYINIEDSDFDAVDANDTTPSIVENSNIEIVKLSKKKGIVMN